MFEVFCSGIEYIRMSEVWLDRGFVLYELLLHVLKKDLVLHLALAASESDSSIRDSRRPVKIPNQNLEFLEVRTEVTCRFGSLLWTLDHGLWDVLAGFLSSSWSFNFRILARGSPLTVSQLCLFALKAFKSNLPFRTQIRKKFRELASLSVVHECFQFSQMPCRSL